MYPFPATDIKHAKELLVHCLHRVNAFICNLRDSKDTDAKSEIWRTIRSQTFQQGYFMTQKCFILVDNRSAQISRVRPKRC